MSAVGISSVGANPYNYVNSIKNKDSTNQTDSFGKKVGEMHLGKGRTSDTEGYATIRSVDIDKAHRGQGMGHQLYKTALKYVHEKYKGIGSEQPDRINKKQVPSILRRMGGVNHESGDITIDRNQQ